MLRNTLIICCAFLAAASIQESEMFSYPWLAGVGSTDSNLFACTGALVHQNWVLTSGHCDLKIGGAVHLHRHDMYDYAEKGAQVARIQQIVRHPNFQKDTLENDLALIGFCSNCTIPTVKLPNQTMIEESSVFLTAGWGKISVINNQISKRLHQMKVQALATSVCKNPQHYGRANVRNMITDNNICIKRGGFGYSCQEDPGTPLFEGNTLYGLSSWSIGCGDAQHPGVYTKVSSYSEWIRKIVASTKVTGCEKKHRHLQQEVDCTTATSCTSCAGANFVNLEGVQKFCSWCDASSTCGSEDSFANNVCASDWTTSANECAGVTGSTGTGSTGTGSTTSGTSSMDEPTETPTEPATETPTEPATEAPTEPATEAPTEPATEAPTEPVTEEPTDTPTEPATESTSTVGTSTMGTSTMEPQFPTETPTEIAIDPDMAKCGFGTCSDCAGRRYTDDEANEAQCYWCGGQSKCITQAAWETNEVCDSQAFTATECTSSTVTDKCALSDSTCGACVANSYTDEVGVFKRCVWCGNSCLNEARVYGENCQAPTRQCSATEGPSDSTCATLNWPVGPGASVCANSLISGKCSYSLPFELAKSWCRDKGARLCTAEELKNDVAVGSGCKLDTDRVWSSTQCEGGAHSLAGSSQGLDSYPEKCESKTESLKVRCCADQPSSSSVAPSSFPKPKTCAQLRWSVAPASPSVCANSEFLGGSCGISATFDTAQSSCLAIGARLCTHTELSNDEAKGSGCKLDSATVWSSTTCTNGAEVGRLTLTGSYDGNQPICSPTTLRFGVRCCADQPEAKQYFTCEDLGWDMTAVVSGTGVCAESKVNGVCSQQLSQADAVAFCAASGTRVCSSNELASGAAKGSGCKLDTERVWTSTSCQDGFLSRVGSSDAQLVQCDQPQSLLPVRCCASSSSITPSKRTDSVIKGMRG